MKQRRELASSLIQMGTLGKALGCFGAYVAASAELIELLVQRARSFIFTTALPPALACAVLESVRIAARETERRERLWQRVGELADALGQTASSPIVPWIVGSPERAMALSERLWERGLWVQAIRPPTVPEGSSRLRITLNSAHTAEDVRDLAKALQS